MNAFSLFYLYSDFEFMKYSKKMFAYFIVES